MFHLDTFGCQPVGEVQHLAHRICERCHLDQLRADVATDADDPEMCGRICQAIQANCVLERDPELALLQTSGDVRMCPGVDVRIHTQAHRRTPTHFPRNPLQAQEFGFRLHIEAKDACSQSVVHFPRGLAHAGEHGPRRVCAGGDDSHQFACGDDVETAAQTSEKVEDRQIGISLDCIADQVRTCSKGAIVLPKGLSQCCPRVDVAWRSEFLGDARKRHVFSVQRAVARGKKTHFSMVPSSVFLGVSSSFGR